MRARDEKGRAAQQIDHEVTDYRRQAVTTSKEDIANRKHMDIHSRGQDEMSVELQVLLDKFQDYFAGRSQIPDVPIVLFGLQHLFCSMHTLCTLLLPEITREAIKNIPSDENRGKDGEENDAYGLWLLLQNGIELLLKIEPLCQLLQNALIEMLETLDATCSIRNLANLQDTDEMIQVAYSAKRRCTYIVTRDQDRWQWAITRMRKRITDWRRHTLERLTRLRQETVKAAGEENTLTLLESIVLINRLGNACIESSGAIFGDILPDLHILAPGDDEAAAIVLLDLMQRLDQLVMQVGQIVQPLHTMLYQITAAIDIQ